jgi:4a-hydroxytetrahydrobiopterin dehydratase
MADLQPPWMREGAALIGEWKFADFKEALAFVNRIGDAAEEANHHPDISIKWNRVRLTLSTHSAGTVTEKDYALAEVISGLA